MSASSAEEGMFTSFLRGFAAKLSELVGADDVPVVAVSGDKQGLTARPTGSSPTAGFEDVSPMRERTKLCDYLAPTPFHTGGRLHVRTLTVTDMVSERDATTTMHVLSSAIRDLDSELEPAKRALTDGRERHRAQMSSLVEKNQQLVSTIQQATARERAAQAQLAKITPHLEMMDRQLRIVNNWGVQSVPRKAYPAEHSHPHVSVKVSLYGVTHVLSWLECRETMSSSRSCVPFPLNHGAVDDWIAPVKPLQSQQAWLHAMEQEAMLDDVNDEWADLADERAAATPR
eukprot:CAMPEP_0115832634 /NCGR_PEP_ID=MMETSP0287-20121206/2760_1 /TAXON_ID=412157 /ORGANISM="Chrysochromulina rotalis, Strain UIO044" /LENGTH=286 /DNA_ID=CAMNT_0003286027 /DNA_START=65 /DNA_END=926 /DNA_ORIENTATION=-